MSDGTMRDFTWQEVCVMLTNLQWILRNRPDARFFADCDTLVYGDGGVDMTALAREGFTPGTSDGWMGRLRGDNEPTTTAQTDSDGTKG